MDNNIHGGRPVAYVSGASRGIGKEIARRLCNEGYDLALSCHGRSDLLEELAEELREKGSGVLEFTLDVSDSAAVASMAEKVLETYGRIDVVVNNAGMSEIGLITDMDDEAWDRILGTNLSSVFYTCRAFVPAMVNTKSGHIINISSIWGSVGASCEVAYSATKGGVNAMTRALAKELAPSGISVNAISCGVIDTEMNDHLDPDEKHALAEEIPVGRFGRPEEVAAALCAILQMPYTTGQIIGVDGAIL